MPMYRKVNKDFFKTWTPEMAYVLGFFAADGNMICGPRGNHYIGFYSTDKELINYVKIAMESEHKIGIHIFPKNEKTKHWKTRYKIQIGSKEIFNDLLKLGMMPNKSLKMKFPKVPNKFLRDFVRGYFDGDGCIYFKKHYVKARDKMKWSFSSRFISGNRKFLEQLHSVLNPHLKKGFIVKKIRGYELVFSHLDSLALYKFMYNNVPNSMYLHRKYRKFRKAVGVMYNIK